MHHRRDYADVRVLASSDAGFLGIDRVGPDPYLAVCWVTILASLLFFLG